MYLTSRLPYGEQELDQLVEHIHDSMHLRGMVDAEGPRPAGPSNYPPLPSRPRPRPPAPSPPRPRRLPMRGLLSQASEMLIIAITRLRASGYRGAEPYINRAETLLRQALPGIGWYMQGVRTELDAAIRDVQSARRDQSRRTALLRQALWHVHAARAAV